MEFEKTLPKFKDKVLPIKYRSRGILTIEGFFVCAFAHKYKIDCMIDSGTKNGMSTEIFAKFGIPTVISIDKAQRPATLERLSSYENLIFIEGNDNESISRIIKSNKYKRIGILIDSTKGGKGCSYATKYWDYDNVKFVGLHDQIQYNYIMSKYFNGVQYSDNLKFWNNYGFLFNKDRGSLQKMYEQGKIEHTIHNKQDKEIDFEDLDNFRGFSIGIIGK